MDGGASSGSRIEERRDCTGDDAGDASVMWIWLQYLPNLSVTKENLFYHLISHSSALSESFSLNT